MDLHEISAVRSRVRMKPLREIPVSGFDLGMGSGLLDSEDLVEIRGFSGVDGGGEGDDGGLPAGGADHGGGGGGELDGGGGEG